ncbi:hypothetical protein YPPY102_2932, partial [Yersinia pestis PY-102]
MCHGGLTELAGQRL